MNKEYLAHPKIQRPKTCLLVFVSLVGWMADWWIHISSIVTYLCKNFFLLCWNSCKQCPESSMCCFWLTLSKCSTYFEHSVLSEYTAFWHLNSCAISLNFSLWSVKEFVEFFVVFRDNCQIWVTWAFSIICVCTTTFKFSMPPLNHCFRWNRVWITLIKTLLCLNSISSHQKAILYQQNSDFSIVLKICKSSSSSFCAIGTDIPDPLSPLLPTVHRLWQIELKFWHMPFEG